jgi:hypothetical protein
MPSVPPTGGKQPSEPAEPDKSKSEKTPAPLGAGGGGGSMSAFLDTFTPEERKKFMNILVQNISRQIEKASKKYIEELRKEREDIEKGG